MSGSNIESLADLVGFEKEAKRLGEVATSRTVAEAIVAIPIIRGTSSDTNKISFVPLRVSTEEGLAFNPNRGKQVVEGAKAALRGDNYAVDVVRKSDIEMVRKIQKFIIPPKWDFVANPEEAGEPFIMFIFEFEHEFNRQDLVDMWQNLPPDETRIAKNNIGRAYATHTSLFGELKKRGKTLADLEWIVFKAKQRASINYFEKTLESKDDAEFKIKIGEDDVTKYSYNWPYDYFSLVELVKVGAEVKITKAREMPTDEEREAEEFESRLEGAELPNEGQ